MNKKKICVLLLSTFSAGVSLTAQAAPQGFDWFPRVPGPDDPLHLVVQNGCQAGSGLSHMVTSTPQMRLIDQASGAWEFKYETGSFLCLSAGPPPTTQAIPIPREIEGIPVNYLHFVNEQYTVEVIDGNVTEVLTGSTAWGEAMPVPTAIPPAVIGTWFSPDHAEQGLLVNMTASGDLLVGWTTYGADGKQRWFSGIAPTVSDESSVTLSLTDTGDGQFAGTLPNDIAGTPWGTLTLDYAECGALDVQWNPVPATGLQPGSARMQQLTLPHDAACDIEKYGEAIGEPLQLLELEIEPLPVTP